VKEYPSKENNYCVKVGAGIHIGTNPSIKVIDNEPVRLSTLNGSKFTFVNRNQLGT
jgi:hypothetical protein